MKGHRSIPSSLYSHCWASLFSLTLSLPFSLDPTPLVSQLLPGPLGASRSTKPG